jgi:hypothetical protein
LEGYGYGKGGVEPPHSKALRTFSWFLGAAGGMGDCHENGVGAALVAAQGAHKGRPYKAFRAFSCHVASPELMESALRMTRRPERNSKSS